MAQGRTTIPLRSRRMGSLTATKVSVRDSHMTCTAWKEDVWTVDASTSSRASSAPRHHVGLFPGLSAGLRLAGRRSCSAPRWVRPPNPGTAIRPAPHARPVQRASARRSTARRSASRVRAWLSRTVRPVATIPARRAREAPVSTPRTDRLATAPGNASTARARRGQPAWAPERIARSQRPRPAVVACVEKTAIVGIVVMGVRACRPATASRHPSALGLSANRPRQAKFINS